MAKKIKPLFEYAWQGLDYLQEHHRKSYVVVIMLLLHIVLICIGVPYFIYVQIVGFLKDLRLLLYGIAVRWVNDWNDIEDYYASQKKSLARLWRND